MFFELEAGRRNVMLNRDLYRIILDLVKEKHKGEPKILHQVTEWEKDRYICKRVWHTWMMNYCLVSKDFHEIINNGRTKWVESLDPKDLPDILRKCHPSTIDILDQIKHWWENGQKRDWLEPNRSSRRNYGWKSSDYTLSDFEVSKEKWIFLHCGNSLERLMVHSMAERLKVFHKKIYSSRVYVSDYHQENDGWTTDTNCEGCSECEKYHARAIGVLISTRKLCVRQDLCGAIKRIREKYGFK